MHSKDSTCQYIHLNLRRKLLGSSVYINIDPMTLNQRVDGSNPSRLANLKADDKGVFSGLAMSRYGAKNLSG